MSVTPESEATAVAEPEESKELFGLLAEFETPAEIYHAAEQVRDKGYQDWDVYTPFPVHGMDDAMGIKMTKLPLVVFGAGLTGTLTGVVMQWWMNALNYPWIVSGKPYWSIPANIPIIFELTILFSALTAFFGMFIFNGLPMLYHAVFQSRRFARATDDPFFLGIETTDPLFDEEATRAFLEALGGQVEELEE